MAHAAATQAFANNFEFYGKSLTEWSHELAVLVPEDPTPDELRRLFAKVARNIQLATDLYSRANSISSAIVGGGNLKKSDLVAALVERYRIQNAKRPAASVLERMADSYMNSTVSSRVAARIAKEFFRDRRDVLIETRKCLEQIGFTLHLELKLQE